MIEIIVNSSPLLMGLKGPNICSHLCLLMLFFLCHYGE